jgi:exosortase E/protease (VPEID-CTERM system)
VHSVQDTPQSVARTRPGILARVAILAALFFAEKTFLNTYVDFERAQAAHGLGAAVREAQHWGFRFLVALTAFVTLITYVRGGTEILKLDRDFRAARIRYLWLLAHFAFGSVLPSLSFLLYRNDATSLPLSVIVALWVTIALIACAFAILALAPLALWRGAARAIGSGWIYAGVAAVAATSAMQKSQLLWAYTATLTFDLVKFILTPIAPSMSADGITHVLRSDRFAIEITWVCSGLEGMGLVLAFTASWLIYFRREYVFPRALVIIPIGLVLMFALNVLRIAALFLIGNAGYPDVAIYGFHSQAGWISFILVACGLVFFSRRSQWLSRSAVAATDAIETYNPTAAYLIPLLAILAAGVISHAISGSFEIFYPLRFVAALGALYYYRDTILEFDWRFTWRGLTIGVLVFFLWLISAHALSASTSMPWQLQSLGPLGRSIWIAVRALASITTVPIAEEIAYRGYLMRRLVTSDFESVSYRSIPFSAVVISAIVFGLAHGAFWLPGTLAGIAYGLLLRQTGRIGEAVVAHAVSNALIVICVLAADMWQLW